MTSLHHVEVTEAAAQVFLNDRFELVRRMGSDGEGDVFLAQDQVSARPVAITVLFRGSASDPALAARFESDVRVAAGLSHPNIVRTIDWGAHDDALFLVKESVEGTTLTDKLRAEGAMTAQAAARVAADLAAALGAAHRLGISHGELSADNVVVTSSGHIKLAGFGWARAEGGTNPIGDLQALGSLLEEMVTAGPPPEAAPPPVVDSLFVDDSNIAGEAASVPPPLRSIIDRLVAPSPSFGYPSAEAVEGDLRSYRDAPAPTVPPPPPAHRHEPQPDGDRLDEATSSPLFLVTLAMLLLVMIGAAVYLSNAISGSSPDTAAEGVDVPTVIGDSRIVAVDRLAAAGFVVEELFVESDEFDDGTVFAQDPPPRSVMTAGELITISIAQAPETVVVPDVVDKTRTEAVDQLSALGLTVDVRRESSEVIDMDLVIEQSLRAGDEVANDADITVVVSTGPERAIVPSLVGLSNADAAAELERLGFENLRWEQEPSFDIATDNVVRTEPAGDSQIELTAPIVVFVSTGDHDFVPGLVGLGQNEAEQLLRAKGFNPEIDYVDVDPNSAQVGVVVAQGPDNGALVPIGSRVTLRVGREEDRGFWSWWDDRDDRKDRSDRGRGNSDD